MAITYQVETQITVQEFIEVLQNSTLAERRPIEDLGRMQKMLDYANLIVTARDNGKLIGVGRAMTDYAFCTYLSDLAVDAAYQKIGVGKELLRLAKKQTPQAKLILLAAPKAVDYYPKIGMSQWEKCFYLDEVEDLI